MAQSMIEPCQDSGVAYCGTHVAVNLLALRGAGAAFRGSNAAAMAGTATSRASTTAASSRKIISDPDLLIGDFAQSIANRGPAYLDSQLRPAQARRARSEPWLRKPFWGTTIQRLTAEALDAEFPGRFESRGRGPDFLDRETGRQIELTTPGEVASHRRRGGDYRTCETPAIGSLMTEPFRVDARAGRRQAVSESDRLTIEKERVVAADYSGRRLAALWSVGSRFEGCSFERIRVEDAHFGSGNVVSEYVECRFDGSVLRAPTVGTARFVRCSFREVQLKDWSSAADIIDCVFSGRAKSCVFRGFAEDPLTGERLREAEFRGNDFSGMHFVDVVFRGGIDLREQRLPSGELDLYLEDARSALDRAQQWLAAWSDHDRREDAVLDLDLLRREVEVHGQEQLYVNVGDLERDPVTQRALLDALRS